MPTAASNAAAQQVIQHFQRIVRADGGTLDLMDWGDNVARFHYQPGSNAECDTCVLSADDLRAMLSEALQARDPALTAVELTANAPPVA